MNEKNIRNFSIIAHIDHGKSTLADRLLEKCNAVSAREMEDQILDNMDLERERGITIKARAVTFDYTAADGQVYTLNLIDTPGHVDFNYEVSRSLAACEGALLVVDASQGIEAQTLANTYLAMEHDLEIRPVLNKIDLPAADPKRVKQEIEDILAIPAEDAPEISAKQGINIDAVLEDIVQNLPCPQGDPNAPLQALIFDSYYDAYRGVIVYMRLKQGTIKPGMEVKMMATGATFKVLECGLMRPLGLEPAKQLEAGQVGYFTASIKDVHETQIGDTVTGVEHPASEPLPGYRKVRSMVYCGIYTEDGSDPVEAIRAEFEPKGIKVFPMSAVTGQGVKELLYEVNEMLQGIGEETTVFAQEYFPDSMTGSVDDAYTVTYDEEEDEYVVEGPKIEKMLGYTNLDSEKGFTFFQNFLKDAGILEELESLGIQEGDTVRMYGLSFDYYK